MIIDDAHQVAFIHIPKCGGTSVRRQIRHLDSYRNFFFDVREHPVLGLIDFCHIPLVYLERHFPEAFEKISRYQAFALVRDPHSRFTSATFQRLALYGGIRRTAATIDDALREAENAMRWLGPRESFCNAEFTHFTRQVDYVAVHGRTVVHNVHALAELQAFGAKIQQLTGVVFDPDQRDNVNFAASSRLLTALHFAKPLYSRLTTWNQREALLKMAHRWRLRRPDPIYARFRENPTIRAFVDSYYADDLKLYEAARARMTSDAGQT